MADYLLFGRFPLPLKKAQILTPTNLAPMMFPEEKPTAAAGPESPSGGDADSLQKK